MYFSGRIHSVIYEDPAQAFYILKMVLDKASNVSGLFTDTPERVSVRGNVPGLTLKVGTWFGFEGDWVNHKDFGPQITISKAPVFNGSWDADTASKMLAANGVGERLLFLVQAYCGEQFLEALQDVEALKKVPGIDEFTAMHINQRWLSTKAYFQTLMFLNDLKIPAGKIRQIWDKFGVDAEKVLCSDPWSLVKLDDIPFTVADEIGMRLGLSLEGSNRIKGAITSAVKEQRNSGHLYMRTGQIVLEVQKYIPDVDVNVIAQSLRDCHKENTIVLDKDTVPGLMAVYDPWSWKMESDSAQILTDRFVTAGFGKKGVDPKTYISRLASVGPQTRDASQKKGAKLAKVVKTAIDEWGATAHLTLSETQKKGVFNALTEPISVLTGLPGTGKTTSLYAVVRILRDAGVPFLLCAPTGIAAKRLASLTHAPAYTIHRAFEAKGASDEKREFTYMGIVGDSDGLSGAGVGEKNLWGFNQDKTHPAEVVIVDESSMMDQHLLYRLLTCTSPQCRMVFVGDAAQLPPVGPGNVLRDMVNSKLFPTVALTEIFRQKDTSDIVFAAHSIYRGEVPESQEDFKLIEVVKDEQALEVIVKLAAKLYEKRANFQVLSPRHAGVVGVTNLNTRLRELLNPQDSGRKEVRLGSDVIREDDRIMVIKNDYELKVYNGDVGKVSRIDSKAKEVEIKVFGEIPQLVRVEFKDVPNLIRLAYACTVHKAQGLEYDCVVMPLMNSFKQQLQRNLLYTAVTRAKHRVFLVGTKSALASAVENDKEDQRNTLFRPRLENFLKK